MARGKLLSALKHTTSHHGSPDITPVGDTQLHSSIVRESPVDMEYRVRGSERFIRIKVWCKTKEGLFRFTDIKVSGSRDEMQQKCGVTAAILAEQLCELYGNLSAEPSECAKAGGRHFRELCDHLEAQAAL